MLTFGISGLLSSGKSLARDLETHGALAVYVPLEGGHEGRYRRRIRSMGYPSLSITARGLGDVSAYLMGVHGVRPPHLGKKGTTAGAAVGDRYYVPPIIPTQLAQLPKDAKGLLLWVIEGNILSSEELEYLANLPKLEPRVKIIVEMGGDRTFTWTPLTQAVAAA